MDGMALILRYDDGERAMGRCQVRLGLRQAAPRAMSRAPRRFRDGLFMTLIASASPSPPGARFHGALVFPSGAVLAARPLIIKHFGLTFSPRLIAARCMRRATGRASLSSPFHYYSFLFVHVPLFDGRSTPPFSRSSASSCQLPRMRARRPWVSRIPRACISSSTEPAFQPRASYQDKPS